MLPSGFYPSPEGGGWSAEGRPGGGAGEAVAPPRPLRGRDYDRERVLILPYQQRRDALDRNAAIGTLRAVGRDLEELLAIALGHQVLRRHHVDVGQYHGDRFGAAIRQRQVVDVVARGIGVTFDHEYLARVALHRAQDALCHVGEAFDLAGRHLPRAGFEIHRVDVDPRHALAQRLAIADFV